MLISWIIPLYNCKDYIGACIDSILSLGLDENDFEIIVVNDGSTDGGERIVAQVADSYLNVHLLSQANQGVSAARNLGLRHAQGEYVHFMDADDRVASAVDDINTSLFEPMRSLSPDLVVIDFTYVYSLDAMPSKALSVVMSRRTLKEQCDAEGFSASACTHFIRRSIIVDHNISFGQLRNGEDQLFMIDICRFPNLKVLRTNALVYMWLQRMGSASHSVSPQRVLLTVNDLFSVAQDIKKREYLKAYSREVYDNFILTYQQCAVMISMLSAKLQLSNVREIISRGRTIGIYPIPWTGSKAVKVLSLLSRSPLAAWLASPLYRKVYLRAKKS